jgi:hypothetical protein
MWQVKNEATRGGQFQIEIKRYRTIQYTRKLFKRQNDVRHPFEAPGSHVSGQER